MKKKDLIDTVALKSNLPKSYVQVVLNHTLDTIISSLMIGEDVQINGFGTFSTKQLAQKVWRNPANNKEMLIPPITVPSFRYSKIIKDIVKSTTDNSHS